MWQQFDSRFRMVVSRRNIILLIMTVGLLLGRPAEAFALCAAWSVVSVLIQGLRYGQAISQFAPRTDPRLAGVKRKRQIKQLAWREYLPLAATAAMWAVIVARNRPCRCGATAGRRDDGPRRRSC